MIAPVLRSTRSGTSIRCKSTTAWYASFAPADNPRYAVVMMVTQGGTGSLTVGPSVRMIYEALFGVIGDVVDPSQSVLIGGQPSTTLPVVKPDGTPVMPESEDVPTLAPTPSASATGASP